MIWGVAWTLGVFKNFPGEPTNQPREFPGGPVVRTPCFHCWGPGVPSLVRELRSHKPCSVAKKKKKKEERKKEKTASVENYCFKVS